MSSASWCGDNWTLGGGVTKTLKFIVSWLKVWVVPGTCEWYLKWEQSCGTGPLTCGDLCFLQLLVSELNWIGRHPMVVRELVAGVGKKKDTCLVSEVVSKKMPPKSLFLKTLKRGKLVVWVLDAVAVLIPQLMFLIPLFSIFTRASHPQLVSFWSREDNWWDDS